jgi:hypothetical protein
MIGRFLRKRVKVFIEPLKIHLRRVYHSRPNFIIVGAQKAGTSALHRMLQQHSTVTASKIKEIHFFSNDEWYEQGNSIHQYHSFFPLPHSVPKNNLLFETTPIYLYHPKVAARIYHYNPDMKIIIILREPAERALSAWKMYHHHFQSGKYAYAHDPRSFREAIETELSEIQNTNYYSNPIAYVKRGIYIDQIRQYFERFPKEQILIIESSELKENWIDCIDIITSFLRIPQEAISPMQVNQSRVDNKAAHAGDLKLLRKFYQPYNTALYEFLGIRFDWNG